MFESLKRKSYGQRVTYILVSVIFAVVAFSYLYILFWMIMSGMKTHSEIVLDPFGLPKVWHWEHLAEAMEIFEVNDVGFWGMLFNSIWFSCVPIIINHYTTITFAYVCTKYKFPTSNWPFAIIMLMMVLPIYGTGGSMYRIMWHLGLINSYASIIFSIGGFTPHFLYYQAFFKNLSPAYTEATKIDGANDFQTYFRVILPLAKPILFALGITSWIVEWNSYSEHMINNPKLPTLPVGIYQFNTEMIFRARLDILFVACLIVCIPTLILFIAFNKTIMTNVSLGGLKG